MSKEVARIVYDEDSDWVELDFRESQWHEVYLAWERKLGIVAIVLTEYNAKMKGVPDVTHEVTRAAIVPNDKALDAFRHPFSYIKE